MQPFAQILWDHFYVLPKMLGFQVFEIDGVKIIICGLGSSMFNIVYGCFNTVANDWSKKIQKVIDNFNGQPFAWWIPNSSTHSEFIETLKEAGFVIEANEIAMRCDLGCIPEYVPKTELVIQQVNYISGLEGFISIIEPYDLQARLFFEKIPLHILDKSAEVLFVGSIDNKPVVIGSVFEGLEKAGIFNVITCEKSRGKGFASDLMSFLLNFVKHRGKKWAMLSASNESGYRIYERLGFEPFGKLECLEYKG